MSKKKYILDNIEDIKYLINNKTPISEIARKYNVKYETLTSNLKKINIEYTTNQHRKDLPHYESRKSAMYYIENNLPIAAPILRKKLIEEGIKENKCENQECGITEWHGKFLPLELHHINGNHYDNRLENIILLCSNCHAQIHGYNQYVVEKKNKIVNERKSKIVNKRKTNSIKKIETCLCPVCKKEFVKKKKTQKYCSQECLHQAQRTNNITKEEIIKYFKEKGSFVSVAKMYNITDTALKKWCKKYGLPIHKKEMTQYCNNIQQ